MVGLDAKPFTELLYKTLLDKSCITAVAAPSASTIAPSLPSKPIQAPAINPNPPANAPTGPSVVSSYRPPNVIPPTAGPSIKRDNGDVDMEGGNGPAQNQGRRKCYDYHGESKKLMVDIEKCGYVD